MKALRVVDVADRLGVSRQTVTRWIRAGYFPGAYRADPEARTSYYCIPESDVEVFERKRKGYLPEKSSE